MCPGAGHTQDACKEVLDARVGKKARTGDNASQLTTPGFFEATWASKNQLSGHVRPLRQVGPALSSGCATHSEAGAGTHAGSGIGSQGTQPQVEARSGVLSSDQT